jgi:predicted oxidoreductase
MVPKIRIAPNGMELSRITLGIWRLNNWRVNSEELEHIIHSCIDLGVTSFDHADVYGNFTCEERFGEVLRSHPEMRSQIQIISKCGVIKESQQRPGYKFHYYDTSKEHIISSVERSLKNFGTEYLDVFLIHRSDYLLNADEVAGAFNQLKAEGKVLNFGVSNFLPFQFELLQSRLDFPLVTNQVEASVMHMEALDNGVLDQCQRLRISPMIWSPLAGGRIFIEQGDQFARTLKLLSPKYHNAAFDQLALSWLLRHPSNPVVIIGTGKLERIKSAVDSVDINLSREDWYRMWTASKGYEVP